MALARVRGCAELVLPVTAGSTRLADASRRQNGPRKATSRRLITVRLRGKSCLAGEYRVPRNGRRAVVAMEGREPLSRRMWGRRPGRPGECLPPVHGTVGGMPDGHYLQEQAHQRPGAFPEACRR